MGIVGRDSLAVHDIDEAIPRTETPEETCVDTVVISRITHEVNALSIFRTDAQDLILTETIGQRRNLFTILILLDRRRLHGTYVIS